MEHLLASPLLWLVITMAAFLAIAYWQSTIRNTILKPFVNPLLLAIVLVIGLLVLTQTPYETYHSGGQYLRFLVTPAIVSLAIKLEKNFDALKQYYPAIISGIVVGVILHTILIFLAALVFNFDRAMFATLFPKSVTSAIAIGISESLGGFASLTVAVVVFTGVVGNVIGEMILKASKVTDPIAQGVALGMSTHTMGTAKAIEMGEVQGAMSGLSIVVTGITVVLCTPLVDVLIPWIING